MNKYLLTFLLAGSISLSATAQKMITGKVLDAISRQPLEGANVVQDGINNSIASTDKYGRFSIKVRNSRASITVTYMGYNPGSAIISGNSNLVIAMQPDAVNIKDVVITHDNGSQKFTSLAKVDLELKPVKNTQELMRIMPGLFVAQHAGGGKAEQIFLRGFDCDHGTDIQVSVDGMPVNMVSHAHGQGYADAHFIIPETINNIDYGAGPYYTQRGNLNTAGYINFSTYKNIPKSTVQVEAGRFNTLRSLVMIDLLKKNKDKQSAYIAGEYNYTDGPTQHKQHFNRINGFGKYNLTIGENTQLAVQASAFTSKWDASGQVPTRAVDAGIIDRFGSVDPTEGGNTERYNGSVNINHRFSNDLSWEHQAYYSRYTFSLFSNFTFFLNNPVDGDGINQAEKRNIYGYQTRFSKKTIYNALVLTSIQGAGVRYDVTKDSYLSNTTKRVFRDYIKRGDIKEANAFVYLQEQAAIGKFFIDAGVRFDYLHFDYFDKLTTTQLTSQGKAIVSPKLNIQYTVSKRYQLYIKAGKGFHSNDTRVVVANNGKEILPAAYGADLGVILKPTQNLLLNIAAWYLHSNQEFVYVGDDGNVEPSGKSSRQGIDIIARYQLTQGLFANINLNFTRPRAIGEAKGEDYIPLAPTFTSTGGIFYKQKQGFNGGLTYRYIKNRPANEDNSIVAKGYCVLDGTINYTRPKYEVGIAMENLFNVKWNEAQFATESRLQNEPAAVTELNYTPGNPLFIRAKIAVFF